MSHFPEIPTNTEIFSQNTVEGNIQATAEKVHSAVKELLESLEVAAKAAMEYEFTAVDYFNRNYSLKNSFCISTITSRFMQYVRLNKEAKEAHQNRVDTLARIGVEVEPMADTSEEEAAVVADFTFLVERSRFVSRLKELQTVLTSVEGYASGEYRKALAFNAMVENLQQND